MKKVFIGGSRRISRLNAEVTRRIDQMIERELDILIGDANGADKAVQAYLSERQYPNVAVFCTGGQCRNNVAGWPETGVMKMFNIGEILLSFIESPFVPPRSIF